MLWDCEVSQPLSSLGPSKAKKLLYTTFLRGCECEIHHVDFMMWWSGYKHFLWTPRDNWNVKDHVLIDVFSNSCVCKYAFTCLFCVHLHIWVKYCVLGLQLTAQINGLKHAYSWDPSLEVMSQFSCGRTQQLIICTWGTSNACWCRVRFEKHRIMAYSGLWNRTASKWFNSWVW